MAQSYRFGPVEVRPAERQLLVEGKPAALGARAFDLLLALIDHRDRVVGKNELLDLVWPGVVVEENNLQVQVSTLRKLLGERAIATVPGRGYRFTLGDSGDSGPSCPLPSPRHNLPAQLSSFIGRERDIERVKELLLNARLVTLTSAGGTGKTRLSLQVASQVMDDFPDGVWFVELAPIDDEQRVAQVVAFVLGVKEEGGRPILEALASYVRSRRLLIVLDNCEHVAAACASLAKALLRSGPGVKIVASSREHLRVPGEASYPVPALAVPGGDDELDPSSLTRYEAVRLFVDRTSAVNPGFRLTGDNALAVTRICRRLDGIPLAIELAAARARALSVERIALLLDDCFRVLTEGDQTALPRQRTLRASIDWSYDLLSIPERMVLRRLAVFAGGWSVEAAEAVCRGGDVAQADVIDLLGHLVDKSLVERDGQGERYRLLETVRQYAQELLAASGEEEPTRRAHFDFFLAFAEQAKPELIGPNQAAWLERIDADRENLLLAHRWCQQANLDPEAGLRLASSLKHSWIIRGRMQTGHRVMAEALARMKSRNTVRCAGLFDAGQLSGLMGRYAEARAHLEESLSIAREIGDERRIAAVLQPLGMACHGLGDRETARACLEEALERARKIGIPRNIAAANNALGQFLRAEGHADEAQPLYEQALEILREVGDRESSAIIMLNVAMTSIARGLPDRARSVLVEVIDIAQELGSRREGQSVMEVAAGLAASGEEWPMAARLFGAAEALQSESGLYRDASDAAFLEPLVAKTRQSLGEAEFARLGEEGRALSYAGAMAEARAWLGDPTAR